MGLSGPVGPSCRATGSIVHVLELASTVEPSDPMSCWNRRGSALRDSYLHFEQARGKRTICRDYLVRQIPDTPEQSAEPFAHRVFGSRQISEVGRQAAVSTRKAPQSRASTWAAFAPRAVPGVGLTLGQAVSRLGHR